jgi:hypothetical protein
MALTFSDKLGSKHPSIGGMAFRVYEVTHDGSETSIDASSFDLTYFYSAILGSGTMPVTSGSSPLPGLATNHGASLSMTALSAGATSIIWAMGY